MHVCVSMCLQFLRFIEQLSGIIGVDCISADVGLDASVDAVLVRTEQLAKHEASSVTEQKSQIYALKRKLKTMKEQLDGKVRLGDGKQDLNVKSKTKALRLKVVLS